MYDAESLEDRAWTDSQSPASDDDSTDKPQVVAPKVDDIPIEPELGADVPDADQVRDALIRFHLYGQRPDGDGSVGDGAVGDDAVVDDRIPAMFFPYRDLTRVRHDYPLCNNGSDVDGAFRPLTSVIDDALDHGDAEGDALEQIRRDVYRVEASIKASATEFDKTLSHLWDEATSHMLQSDRISEDRKATARESLDKTKAGLPGNARLVACGRDTAAVVFAQLAESHWGGKSAAWRNDLDTLISRLQSILAADEQRSEVARRPEHLRESVADDGVDVDAMSTIMEAGASDSGMAASRRERISGALATIIRFRSVFGGDEGASAAAAPFDVAAIATSCADAIEEHRIRTEAMVIFFKAVHVAKLEADNKYREAIHDAFFSDYDDRHVTEAEFTLTPPVLLRIKPASLTTDEAGALLDMLGSGIPLKVLVEVDDVSGDPVAFGPSMAVWPSRIGRAAMVLGDVFVTQVPVSRASYLQERIIDGFNYGGPSLFVVFTGKTNGQDRLDTYLMAEAVAESRVFPTFTFDPGKGDTHADRMDIITNTQVDNDWPVESLTYRVGAGADAVMELAFTPADLLACERRFDDQFWHVDRSMWHDDMLPINTFVKHGHAGSDTAIPYIVTIDENGRLGRAVVSRGVLATVIKTLALWHDVQENGGVNNSFAERLVTQEKQRLEEEKQREVEAIENNYSAQLDQDIGDLTQEIVQRVVGRLLSTDGMSQAPPLAAPPTTGTTATPAPAAPEAEPASAQEDETDDDVASFDDPYIDTPLCTSCNECTEMNGRLFAYNENKQAFIKDASAGTFQELVKAAEVCPVHIIHPGKPINTAEPGVDEWVARAARFN